MLHCLQQLLKQFSFRVLNTLLPSFTKIPPEKNKVPLNQSVSFKRTTFTDSTLETCKYHLKYMHLEITDSMLDLQSPEIVSDAFQQKEEKLSSVSKLCFYSC